MMYRARPHFIIKRNLQKTSVTGVRFSDVVTPNVLQDVCRLITGEADFSYDYVDNDYFDEFLEPTYNKGRMAILEYQNEVSFISFSEKEIGGRNSSVQSVPTAFNLFYLNPYPHKRLFYYFLNLQGNPETDYHLMMYRLMKTIGFEFLNEERALTQRIHAFTSIEDIMFSRRINSGRNRSNNGTYITKNGRSQIEIYGKTYGASKYETSLICYALSLLRQQGQEIALYEVLEGNLKELPILSLNVIRDMGAVKVIPTDMQLEKRLFEKNDSLRSPRYIYNLLNKFGKKRCALCGCEIPELIQGAHIWPVASIKREPLSLKEKLEYATDGENGLWLCENHHKLFDTNIIKIDESDGHILYRRDQIGHNLDFLQEITIYDELPDEIMTDAFCEYLWRRNRAI